MVVNDLIKNRQAITATENDSVLDVARQMVAASIGGVPVMRHDELVGIFTERDLMKRVVIESRDPATTRVAEVLTPNPATVSPKESLDNCMLLMKQNNIRHVPVCENGRLKGMVCLRDILLYDVEEKDDELEIIRNYVRSAS